MASEIRIRWDGAVAGIAEGRLSLSAFGEPLNLLLAALRRIATQMVGNAVEGGNTPRSGRFANLARQLDVEIIDLKHNSTGFDGLVSFYQPPEELALFADLPGRTVSEFMEAMERESKGEAVNWAVRNYLGSMPSGIRTQTYDLYENNALQKTVTIGEVKLAELPSEFPYLRELEGSIVGVGFDPGKSEVRIKSETAVIGFDATDLQVERALEIRKEDARLFGITDGKRSRLLRIEKAGAPRFIPTRDAIEEHIFSRWDGVFARLAE
jgi:hypothetical protein